MEIGLEDSLAHKAVERSSFDLEKFDEEFELVPEAALEIFEGARWKSAEELCTSVATDFWTIACGASKTFSSTLCVASVAVAFIWK